MPGPVRKGRATLPGANELFRPTRAQRAAAERVGTPSQDPRREASGEADQGGEKAAAQGAQTPAATGRVRHDQKITVYFSSEELFALEDATLNLKRHHGLALDRGRLVRTAVALALADIAENGEGSAVVEELRQQ
ncbi:hypothetical protein FOJ82_15745 [Tessaracoccus rhinocerotis]|uniref:Cobyrinic acid a,c-diamide synthase n=1 Tax=Tessaracoccus rhinocerotis TaxID=1689449 RepID=A0A553JW13_9ACTN|nr:hypothetical protein [Tessaracoccus rhinocerotis]TRY16634.1 hypothetical protein FOJ82_15745 [Tessaracoccus rhinocerotis]